MQFHKNALIALLALYSIGAMSNECAILSTGAASDLAIENPERFEYLTRICRGESATKRTTDSSDRYSPASTLRSQGSVAEKSAKSGKPKSQATSDDKRTKENIGCEFLFHPVSGSRHSIETEACKNGVNMICKRAAGANGAEWVKGGTACANAPDYIQNYELNLKHNKAMLKRMENMYD